MVEACILTVLFSFLWNLIMMQKIGVVMNEDETMKEYQTLKRKIQKKNLAALER